MFLLTDLESFLLDDPCDCCGFIFLPPLFKERLGWCWTSSGNNEWDLELRSLTFLWCLSWLAFRNDLFPLSFTLAIFSLLKCCPFKFTSPESTLSIILLPLTFCMATQMCINTSEISFSIFDFVYSFPFKAFNRSMSLFTSSIAWSFSRILIKSFSEATRLGRFSTSSPNSTESWTACRWENSFCKKFNWVLTLLFAVPAGHFSL